MEVSTDESMHKNIQNVYLYNGILFSNKNEWSMDTWYNMVNLETLCYVNEASHKWTHIIWFYFN